MFYVKDTGIGGLSKVDSAIFKSFTKLEHCYERANKGFGLGLNIARGKVTLLGGEIWVESNELKGTTFKFSLPMEIYSETVIKEKDTKKIFKKQYSKINH